MKSYDYYYLAKRNLLPNALLRTRVEGKLKPGARVHISAACGKAMASITCMLKEKGYAVTASDVSFQPPMSDVLVAHGIPCLPLSADNVKGVDALVVGNMLPPDSVEVEVARETGIPMFSGAEITAELFSGKRSLVVAGTHGKTTTSALLTHVFETAGKSPAYMIGGVFQNSGESYSFGKYNSKIAVYEGDEYDCAFFDKAPKFLRYNPTSVILTSLEHDHIDLYTTFSDYVQAFQFLIDDLPKGGFLIIHESVMQHVDVSQCFARVLVYGSTMGVDVKYRIEEAGADGTIFSVQTKEDGEIYSHIKIPIFGEYNIANATAVFALAMQEGLIISDILPGIASYPGVRERQEVIGVIRENITIVRDYAHHPTAVSVTLDGLKTQYPKQRLVCVFEPRSVTSRRKIFETEYPKSLSHADISMIVSPPFKENDSRNDFMDISIVKNILESSGKIIYAPETPSKALEILSEIVKPNDVIIFMSNGDFDEIPEKFLNSN